VDHCAWIDDEVRGRIDDDDLDEHHVESADGGYRRCLQPASPG
jgi:hypothetical protein